MNSVLGIVLTVFFWVTAIGLVIHGLRLLKRGDRQAPAPGTDPPLEYALACLRHQSALYGRAIMAFGVAVVLLIAGVFLGLALIPA